MNINASPSSQLQILNTLVPQTTKIVVEFFGEYKWGERRGKVNPKEKVTATFFQPQEATIRDGKNWVLVSPVEWVPNSIKELKRRLARDVFPNGDVPFYNIVSVESVPNV